MTEQRKKRKDLENEIEIDEENMGKFHQDETKEKVSIDMFRGKPDNITNDCIFLLDLYEWGSGDISTEVNDPEVEKDVLFNVEVQLNVQKKESEDLTLVERMLYKKVLKFLRYQYNVESWQNRKEYCKFLVTELNKKRNNQVYERKSIVEKYKKAVKNKEAFSNKPFWKLTDEDELDELLKLRQEINMIADGNCTVYAVISQLYPQTFGGYVLCPSPSAFSTDYVRASKAREKMREIRQIANSSITNNEDASAFGDEVESVGDMEKHTWMSIEHAPRITAHYNRVIVVINPGVTSRMTKVFLPLQKCDFTVSLSLFDRDMSLYHMLL
jgi:hypothetical protein